MSVYIPPSYDSDTSKRCLSKINDTIAFIKRKYVDPYIVLGGDFNKRDLGLATCDHKTVKPVITGPTRGKNVLDYIATDFNDILLEASTTDPIANKHGIQTDHLTVFARFNMKCVPEYVICLLYTSDAADE